MMEIESYLKKFKHVRITPQEKEFEANLRIRLLNQFEYSHNNQKNPTEVNLKELILLFKEWLSSFWQKPAFHFAGMIFGFMIAFTAAASLLGVPSGIREGVVSYFSAGNNVKVTASIEGADVYINGTLVGKTPLTKKLEQGNYTIRVEKEGYGIFSQSIQVADGKNAKNEFFASLPLVLPPEDPHAGWLSYENKDFNFKFDYPAEWSITESFDQANLSKDFTVSLSKATNILKFIFNPSESYAPDLSPSIVSYKRNIKIGGEEDIRLLQFSTDGKFILGGMSIEGTQNHPAFSVIYKGLEGELEDVLNSQILATMDDVLASLDIGEYTQVVASNNSRPIDIKENPNELVNLADPSIDPADQVTPVPTSQISLSEVYINKLYGYKLNYSKAWSVVASRADYPQEQRGFSVENVDQTKGTVARLRLTSDSTGSIYLFISPSPQLPYSNDWLICGENQGKTLYKGNGFSIVAQASGSDSRFETQVCSSTGGTYFTNNSVKNGKVFYSIFWSVDPDEVNNSSIQEVAAIVASVSFNESLISTPLSQIKYQFDNRNIAFEYSYDWNVNTNKISCDKNIGNDILQIPITAAFEDNCESVRVYNANGVLVAEFVEGGLSYDSKQFVYEKTKLINERNISTQNGEVLFREFGDPIDGKFIAGIGHVGSYQILYFVDPGTSQKVTELISGLKSLV